MKPLRILLILPVMAVVSCSNSSEFKTPAVHGKVWAGSGGEHVSIPHGETQR